MQGVATRKRGDETEHDHDEEADKQDSAHHSEIPFGLHRKNGQRDDHNRSQPSRL